MSVRPLLAGVLLTATCAEARAQINVQWAAFAQDPNRIQNPNGTIATQVTNDTDEKHYAWGDVDHDGWTDLVVVRKEPASTLGHRTNQLLMNEHGILVDRTSQYAVDSTIAGDFGFMTPTNDRDVQLVDLDGDGWLDIVTACSLSDGDPKPISHPRVYHNKGSIGGVWQGFRYEDARIPQLLVAGTGLPVAPRFHSVSVGDVTGDGFPDLYFTDADAESTYPEPAAWDLNDRLLVNDGFGYFTDSGTTRMSAAMLASNFGTSSKILDMNGDGLNDVLKTSSGPPAALITIAYQDPSSVGSFHAFQTVPTGSYPYHVDAGDLNADGTPDLIVASDSPDFCKYNTGIDASGLAVFGPNTPYTYASSLGDDGFGGKCRLADLDGDGLLDAIHADFDAEIPGCTRRCHIFHNPTTSVGAQTALREEAQQSGISGWKGVVGMIGFDLTGTYDVATFDIDNDGDIDLVFGRCAGTFVWINQQPHVTPYCFGDGSGTACPCANASAVGDREGCLNSLGTGGRLIGSGVPSVAADTFHLQGSRMPDSSVLYFQGTTQTAGGVGSTFGDGLRCVSGTIVRLGTKLNVNGQSAFPLGSDPTISVKGMTIAGATYDYQVWYRNSAPFCTPSTFNVTNGLQVAWQP